jgi:serine protein kinase
VFPRQLQLLRDSYFEQRKKVVKKTIEDTLVYLADGADKMKGRLERESFERVETTLRTLETKYGYCQRCARDAISYLMRRRYA